MFIAMTMSFVVFKCTRDTHIRRAKFDNISGEPEKKNPKKTEGHAVCVKILFLFILRHIAYTAF